MKKILFLLMLLIPFIVYGEYDESKVTIESLIKTKTEGYGKEKNAPRINGNNINLDVQFTEVDDSVTYDITIKNESGEDIELYNKLDKSDYVDYTLMAPDLDYVVKNGSSKTFQLQVEYAHAVPESAADEGIYYDNKVYSLEVSNELGRDASALGIEEGGDTHEAVDPTPTSTDVPATVDNPNTKAVKNVLVIVCIIFVISIGLFLILRKKNRIGKVFVIVGLIGIITPLVVFAYKDFKINFSTKATILVGIVEEEPVGDEIIEVEVSGNPICRPATILHTEKCNARSNLSSGTQYYCAGQGIPIGQTITYGTIPGSSYLKPGDAFDCDVNQDHYFDSETERFYYLGEDDDNLIFIAYSNFNGSTPVKLLDASKIAYHSSNAQTQGPVTAVTMLPTKNQWKNVGTNLGMRPITNKDGSFVTTFNYGPYAARLPKYTEIRRACPLVDDVTINGLTTYNHCSFLLENTIYTNTNNIMGYWLETPNFNDNENIWMISGRDKRIYWDRAANNTNRGVRPVIEVDYHYVSLNR